METPDDIRFNRNVLLAVDDSENARRAITYVGFMLGSLEGFRVTLLHVIAEPEEDFFARVEEKEKWLNDYRTNMASILADYRRGLIATGFSEQAIEIRLPRRNCPSIAECILMELDRTAYGTIVVGRRGLSRKEEFLFGSVSSKIVGHARNCAVWVVA